MIIECPSCGARAKIPDSKEGAKVRCAECGRIYVARDPKARGGSGRGSSSALPIGIGAGVIALVAIFVMINNREAPQSTDAVDEPVKAPEVLVDDTGWDSARVKLVRSLHDAAYRLDETTLESKIAFDYAWARVHSTEEELVEPSDFAALGTKEVNDFHREILQELTADAPDNLVGSWLPFDGSVVAEDSQFTTIRLMLQPRPESEATGNRNIEWLLVKEDGAWRAYSWERWLSDAEKKRRGPSSKRTTRTTLSDGSVVIEGEPGPVPYMEETPPAMREDIDGLIAKLIDLDTPAKELTRVRSELQLAAKHAIPPLLTKFYELNLAGFPDMDSAIQAQSIHQMLQDITGYVTTFKAHEALGATKERRDSGVKQWFGWYERKFKKFPLEGVQAAEEADLLEEGVDLDLMSPEERREYEKMKRLIEEEEKEEKARQEREQKQNKG